MSTSSSQTRGSASVQHPLGRDESIPRKIDEGRLAYLTSRIRNGDITPNEREELGRSFIRLALKVASSYAARKPSKADDYSSAALFGIAYALDKAQEKLIDDNITGWVIVNIRRFIRRFYETDHMVRTPSTTYHRAKAEGRQLNSQSVFVVDNRELNAGEGTKTSVLYQRVRVRPSGSIFELKEMLQLSARDDRDRNILKLRSEGYTDAEIAERMEISTTYVQRKRTEIESRFDKLDKE